MNKEKLNLIARNLELLIQSLQLELSEDETPKNIMRLEDLIGKQVQIDDYDEVYIEEDN
jgi:hypothetical protein